MPIKRTKAEAAQAVIAYVGQIRDNIIQTLQYVGEQCINEARIRGSYTDQTGNLRASIGYAVIVNGQPATAQNYSQQDNQTPIDEVISDVVSRFPNDIVLVVVAGMKYAHYVTARGYDVLTSAEDLAHRLVPEMLKELGL